MFIVFTVQCTSDIMYRSRINDPGKHLTEFRGNITVVSEVNTSLNVQDAALKGKLRV